MQFTIMPHKDAYDYARHKYDTPDVIISLDGPGETPKLITPEPSNSIHAVLYAHLGPNHKLDETTARQIANFAKDNAHINNIIVSTDRHHAQAISICAVLMKILAGSDEAAMTRPACKPDFQAYRAMTNAVIDMLTDEFATIP